MADLLSKIRRIVNEGKTRARAANKDFTEAMNKAFDDFDKRVRTAKDRGDVGADPVKFRVARDAFWRTYNAE
jgi:ribosome-associated translation inhibitor RaiA